MKSSYILTRDLKTFVITSFATGSFIIFFSLAGHFLTPTKLIPSSFIGGSIGLMLGTYFCLKQNYIKKTCFFPVMLCSLIAFGIVSFIVVFNFDKPLLILSCFSLVGLTAIIGNHYFSNHHDLSKNKIYGVLGLILLFPSLYFVLASILKFQLGYSFLFSFIDILLNKTNGQANFNAITPFLFVGGLLLAFGLNVFSQIQFRETNSNIFRYKTTGLNIKILNLSIVIITGLTGLAIISYLVVENL